MKHLFAISAYGESPYLEDCISSLERQTAPCHVILCTSTPSRCLEQLTEKHHIPYFVREGASGLKDDWNFCVAKALALGADLLTIAHQDDVYLPKYAENVRKKAEKACCAAAWTMNTQGVQKEQNAQTEQSARTGQNAREICAPSLIFTAAENIDGEGNRVPAKAESVKRLLRWPLLTPLKNTKAGRRLALSFGNSVPCPACTYNLNYLKEKGIEMAMASGQPGPVEENSGRQERIEEALSPGRLLFHSDFRFVIDWACLADLADLDGSFEYIPEPGIRIRLHEGQETARTMLDDTRQREELEMFRRFHSEPAAKLLMEFYRKSSDIYKR